MTLSGLYDIAEKEHIKIYDWHIDNAYGAFINIDKINAIALNYNEFGTSIDEKETLAEELGHYYYDATYPLNCTDKVLILKQERKAKKWAFNTLISFENLRRAILSGRTSILSLAEYFDVTVQFMSNCITFYLEKYGYIITKEEMLQVSI